MSIKRRFQYQYRNFIQSIVTIRLPNWLACKGMRLCLLLFIILFGAAYVFKTTSSASTGYQMSDLEQRAQELEMENKKLEIEIADNSSMQSIHKRLSGINMVTIANIQYFDSKENKVAKR